MSAGIHLHDPTAVGPSTGDRRPVLNALTALRFVSAFAIVLFHLKYTMPRFFTAGWFDKLSVGVGFFFVLSGFVLAYGLTPGRPFSVREFYTKRAVRVLPLHWLTLGVWVYFFYAGWGATAADKESSVVVNALLGQTLVPGLLYCLGCNAVSWSLSNEAVFYLLFPLLRHPIVAKLTVAGVCAAVLAIHLTGAGAAIDTAFPSMSYFCPAFRVAEFAVGVLAGLAFRTAARPTADQTWVEVGLLAALALQVYGTGVIDHYFAQLVTVVPFTLIIWVFAQERGRVSRFLAGSRTLVFLGEASFSLYMWHHMILLGIGQVLPDEFGSRRAIAVGITASVAASVASYVLFENPTRAVLSRVLLRRRPVAPPGPPRLALVPGSRAA